MKYESIPANCKACNVPITAYWNNSLKNYENLCDVCLAVVQEDLSTDEFYESYPMQLLWIE
jgi:hypothetical protein